MWPEWRYTFVDQLRLYLMAGGRIPHGPLFNLSSGFSFWTAFQFSSISTIRRWGLEINHLLYLSVFPAMQIGLIRQCFGFIVACAQLFFPFGFSLSPERLRNSRSAGSCAFRLLNPLTCFPALTLPVSTARRKRPGHLRAVAMATCPPSRPSLVYVSVCLQTLRAVGRLSHRLEVFPLCRVCVTHNCTHTCTRGATGGHWLPLWS